MNTLLSGTVVSEPLVIAFRLGRFIMLLMSPLALLKGARVRKIPPLKQAANILYVGQDKADSPQGLQYFLGLAVANDPLRQVEVRSVEDNQPILPPAESPHLVVVSRAVSQEWQKSLTGYVERGGQLLLVPENREAALWIPGLLDDVELAAETTPAETEGKYLLLGDIYKNPISQPEIQSVAASWKDGVEMVFAGETDAAMVPSYIASEYPNLISVNESREFPGRALSAAPTVPAGVRTAVANAMVQLSKDANQNAVLNEIGATQFVPATKADYAGSEAILRGVFGYQPLRSGPPQVEAPKPATTPAPAKSGG
jgi:hypothetical protein